MEKGSRAKAFLAKLKQDKTQPGQSQSIEPGPQNGENSRKRKASETEAHKLLASIESHKKRCSDIIKHMQNMFSSKEKIRKYPRVEDWIKELTDIEKKLEFKDVVISVLGNTGEGKSSLMNAILDHRDALPTSGMKACTATVVEVLESKTEFFEAEIEFLEEKEWFDELENLCKDLTDESGSISKTAPDRNSGVYESYCKMIAVYGEIDTFDVLREKTEVTASLGKPKKIRKDNLNDLKNEVQTFIEVQEPGTRLSFWPIVKKVRLMLPGCDVCSSGAVLVDLPGRGDSDAARNAIASKHLKYCDAIWIVSSINRAINDRTAQELMGERFRSQLFMDGQFDAVSFICTKSDLVNVKECKRELTKLESLTKDLNEELSELDGQKQELSSQRNSIKKDIQNLMRHIKLEEEEKQKQESNLTELISYLEDESIQDVDESTHTELREEQNEIQNKLQNLEEKIKTQQDKLTDYKKSLENVETEMLDLENQRRVKIKAITEICAKTRNKYCESRIKEDFASIYQAIKRASQNTGKELEVRGEMQVKNLAKNLKVFCCSSTDYQLIQHPEVDDDGPQVFSNVEDTQIPKLRNFVHELTSTRKKESLTNVISSLDGFVSSVQSYLSDKQSMKPLKHSFTEAAIDEELNQLRSSMKSILDKLDLDLKEIFDENLVKNLKAAAALASLEANGICSRWGAKYCRGRKDSGLHFRTYQAAVKREGVYIEVNFNEDLSEPLFRSIRLAWGTTFDTGYGFLLKAISDCKDALLEKRKQCLSELLQNFGIPKAKSEAFRETQEHIASVKMTNTIKELQIVITHKQRSIPDMVTPYIQTCLQDVYIECSGVKGKGMFENIKSKLAAGIDKMSGTMFNQVVDKMIERLHALQTDIYKKLTEKSNDLVEDIRIALEPLWDDNAILRSAFYQEVRKLSMDVQKVAKDFQPADEGPSQKRQKLSSPSGSPEPTPGCSS